MNERELSQCNGKVRFESMGRARKVARDQARRKEVGLEPYRCRYCQGFHVGRATRMPSARRARMREVEA